MCRIVDFFEGRILFLIKERKGIILVLDNAMTISSEYGSSAWYCILHAMASTVLLELRLRGL